MEEDIIKELNLYEKIFVKVFAKTFRKVYNITRVNILNYILRN